MKTLLTLFLLCPLICKAELYSILPADIVLDIPEGWYPLFKDTYPDAPSNVCFPRFDHNEKMSRIDSVMWRTESSLDEALDKYIHRFITKVSDSVTHHEIGREPFIANSGVEGIRYVFESTRSTSCGPHTWKVVRYIFWNSKGKIVCLGGFGDIEEIDRIVKSSLKIE